MDYKKRMEEIAAELLKHQHLYYVQARPEISDKAYDRLFDELANLEKRFPQYASINSPIRRVGSDLDNTFPEKTHGVPVLSLDKLYHPEELGQWLLKTAAAAASNIGFTIEEKIDGASIVLYYDRGELQYALTRGNGLLGNDVSANVRTISQVPLRIAESSPLAVRGEIYITRPDFECFNSGMAEKYANPRNLAAGSLRNLKSALTAKVPLNIFVYEGFFQNESIPDHLDILQRLAQLGFRVNPRLGFFSDDDAKRLQARRMFPAITAAPLASVQEYLRRQAATRRELPYDIDGLVVKVVEMNIRQELGTTAHHPRWAMAYKFDSPQGRTILLDIQVQIGRNGRVTPVALLKPVALSGSTVTRATLHNQDYINMLELGIGDEVSISKRGDVIPAVDDVLEKGDSHPSIYKIPEYCPFCSTPLVKEGAHHFCKNDTCPERRRRGLNYFCAKEQMDIEALGEKTIALLFAKGWVQSIPDIYSFDYAMLAGEEGFKEKKIARIRAGVASSKTRPFARVLAALGLDGVASAAANALIAHGFDSMDKIIAAAKKNDWEIFAAIEGIGETTGRLLVGHFSKPENLQLISSLKEMGLKFATEEKAAPRINNAFAGQIWVITGSLAKFIPRSLAAAEIEKRGGRVLENVSTRTTHLLRGANPGSKLARAEKNHVKIISENDFLRLLRKK
ncbi:MAG: NAD-dependent DNA ligase LigA [Candidatus Aminicenantes bacterium]|nr:NAD-dependent DNA ligase LigA [Candidatus Aminicenantes bacterium]